MLLESLLPGLNCEVNRIQQNLDQMLQGNGWYLGHAVGFPALNIWEEEQSYKFEAELPGFDKDSVTIEIEKDQLTIKGERKLTKPDTAIVHRQERIHTSFERTFTLPATADTEKVSASFQQGILTISLPKIPQALPKKITIQG